jgi:hypothetical protein
MESPQTNSEFVTVAKFLDPAEAQMAAGALESEGIECFLQGENANNIVPMAFRTRLVVNGSDEAAAREILDAAEAMEPATEGDGPA